MARKSCAGSQVQVVSPVAICLKGLAVELEGGIQEEEMMGIGMDLVVLLALVPIDPGVPRIQYDPNPN